MKSKSKSKLLREMYPKSIPKSKGKIPSLGELVNESVNVLDALTDGHHSSGLGEITHTAKELIIALQNELHAAKNIIVSLKDELDEAESTYAENCDCGECGACNQAEGFREQVKIAEEAIERLKLTKA